MISITCLLIFQGAYAIDMHFSASDGGGRSVSIWDYYDVDDGVEVSGESSAGFGDGLSMADSRRISGPGDVYAVQGYSGSGGYVGMNYIYAQDASQTLALGSAHLTPETLGVVQDVSIDGAAESAVVSTGDRGGRSAMQHASVGAGSLDSRQTIDIDGGIVTSQDSQMVGFLPTAFGTAGYMDVNLGPGTLNLEGEGAAVAVSSLDLAGPAEVDCRLATGTGNSAWAYGDVRSASSDLGAVGAGAGAGNVNLEVDLNGNLYIEGEAEAAGIGIGAIGVENEIRGTLAASTGDGGTSAFGEDIEASNKDGTVVAAAAAGGLGGVVDLQNGLIGGGAEAAGVGVLADGKKNEISAGTLAAGTGFLGTGAYGEDVEASNKKGTVVAAAAAGGLGAGVNLQNGNGIVGAEGAIFGAGAAGTDNQISVGGVMATTTNSADVVAIDVEASSREGAAGTGVAAGNVQVALVGGTITTITGEGSAVGAGAIGDQAYAGADRLRAKSGDSTFAAGKGLTVLVENGVAGAGAIGASYDSKAPGSEWKVASVEADITGFGGIRGNFRAETGQSASARANNVFALGNDVHLGSHADDGTSYSDVDTSLSGVFADGRLRAYAGDSTMAMQKGRVMGKFESDVEADSSDPQPPSFKHRKGTGVFDINMKAWTDDTGAYTKAKKKKVV